MSERTMVSLASEMPVNDAATEIHLFNLAWPEVYRMYWEAESKRQLYAQWMKLRPDIRAEVESRWRAAQEPNIAAGALSVAATDKLV